MFSVSAVFNDDLVTNLLFSPEANELWNLTTIWQQVLAKLGRQPTYSPANGSIFAPSCLIRIHHA